MAILFYILDPRQGYASKKEGRRAQILDKSVPDIGFIPEIWQGHKIDGEVFLGWARAFGKLVLRVLRKKVI